MQKFLSLFKNLGAFGLAPVVISLASILSVPVTLHVLGDQVWLSIAVGQTAGELARLLTIWGWNSTGLSLVASMDQRQRTLYYLRSMPVRLVLFCLTALILLPVALFMPVASASGLYLMALAGAVLGLSGSWVFIGAREPGKLLLFDSLPRTLGIFAATGLILLFPRVEVFAGTIILGNAISALGPWIYHLRLKAQLGLESWLLSWSEILQSIRQGVSGFVIGFVMSARMSLPVLAAPLLIPEAATMVALADKFMRWGNTAMTPIMQFVQTGIPRSPGSLPQQIIRGTKLVALLSSLLTLVATGVTYWGSGPMSTGQIQLSWPISFVVGAVLGLVFATTVTGNTSLVLLGRTGTVARYSLTALLILLLALYPAALLWGGFGVMAAYALSELGILLLQLNLLRKLLGRAAGSAPSESRNG